MTKHRSSAVTLAAIAKLQPGDILYDTSVKGFGARRQKDAISYFLKMRVAGRQRWFTIGRHGHPWTPDTARRRALQILGNPDLAEKPVTETALTFAQAAEEFFTSHGPKLRPRTLAEYTRLNAKFLKPAFGRLALADITRGTISKAHAAWKKTPRTANHALAILSKIMSWSEDQGYRLEGSNPCSRIQRYKENRHDRFLQPDELARLGAALEKAEADNLIGPYALAAIRLLIFTGARLSEILTLKWSYIDVDRRMIFLPDSKTGQKPLTLNDPAIDVLKGVPRFANNPYVIVGNRHGAHLVNLQKPWRAVRALASLDDVRIHDLRHTFASVAVTSGGSLPVIGRQLGHSQMQTTQRYAHLADDPVRQLTQSTGTALAEAMRKRDSGRS